MDGGTKPVPLPPPEGGWCLAWMGAMYCCMYTISQLGESELDIKGESAKTRLLPGLNLFLHNLAHV